jgi:hypothetical protein
MARVTFTPREDYYEFTGTGTMQPLIAGLVQKLASPTGVDTDGNGFLPEVSRGLIAA